MRVDVMENYSGSIRIKNAKTLQKWINKGWYQQQIELGYTFYPGCGRFRKEKCECRKCRKPNSGNELKELLNPTRSGQKLKDDESTDRM